MTGGQTGPLPGNSDITIHPTGKPGIGGNALTAPYRAWLSRVSDTLQNTGAYGTTVQRPTAKLYPGLVYYDTTLGKPVFVKTAGSPAVWVDATGMVV